MRPSATARAEPRTAPSIELHPCLLHHRRPFHHYLVCQRRHGPPYHAATPQPTRAWTCKAGPLLRNAQLECLEADRWYVHGTARLDSANWKKVLVDSGYYKESQLR